MKDIVNTKIKFREPYRPFAPSVLAHEAEQFFDMPNAETHSPARFMLYVVPVKADKHSVVPAITHVDGSARPQLVYKEESPRYYALIKKFFDKTGVPMVMNTSFNLKGEAIVNTPADAYSTFTRSGLDLLIIGNYVIAKQ
jgi:carbamoyltransferase